MTTQLEFPKKEMDPLLATHLDMVLDLDLDSSQTLTLDLDQAGRRTQGQEE